MFEPKHCLKGVEAARYIGMSHIWLRQSRIKGTGPAYIRIGRAIRYLIADLDAFIAARRVCRTVKYQLNSVLVLPVLPVIPGISGEFKLWKIFLTTLRRREAAI